MPRVADRRGGPPSLALARTATWLAWALWLMALLFLAGSAGYGTSVAASADRHVVEDVIVPAIIMSLFATVGAVVALRRPAHPIGWLLLVAGWMLALGHLASGYAHHAVLTQSGDPRLEVWAAQLGPVAFFPAFLVLVFVLPLLFPDGRLPSRRWRVVGWSAAIVFPVGVLVEVVLRPGPIPSFPQFTNPLGVAFVAPLTDALDTWLAPLLYGPFIVAAAVAIVMRLRRSGAIERQQFKWVAFPMALMLVTIPFSESVYPQAEGLPRALLEAMFVVAFGGLPVGVGIAVLRYRLYEIDRIVSRTVTYALVTVLLVGVYAGSAVALGSVMQLVTGQTSSDLVIAASTLAVAALFNPLRRRAQRLVDRRFYRSRYQVGHIVDAFSARLRESVDLDEIEADLAAAVRETIQPAAVGIWLAGRPETSDRPGAE